MTYEYEVENRRWPADYYQDPMTDKWRTRRRRWLGGTRSPLFLSPRKNSLARGLGSGTTMDKWNELREYIEQQAEINSEHASDAPDRTHWIGYLARAYALIGVLMEMNRLETSNGPSATNG